MFKFISSFVLVSLLFTSGSFAQFSGPSQRREPVTVEQVRQTLPGRYVTVVGNIVAHQRENYYTFRDATGEIRVEIEPHVWQGREITPDIRVRLTGEIDASVRGRYIWVETLQIVE